MSLSFWQSIFLLACSIHLVLSALFEKNFCSQKKCDKIDPQCKYNACLISPYKESCGRGRCAINENDCKELNLRNQYYNSKLYVHILKHVNKTRANTMRHHDRMFKKLIREIKNCSLYITETPNKISWEASGVCMRRKKCYKQVERVHKTERQLIHVKIECPCDGKHSHECGKDFCVRDNEICRFLQLNETNTVTMKKCSFMNF